MRLRRRTINNIKIAIIYMSALYLAHTFRTVGNEGIFFYPQSAQVEVVHSINNAHVEYRK